MNITESALHRPVTTLMIFVCFVVIGIIASQLLPLEYFPDLDAPFVGVEIPYPGSTPEEVEREITRPAEEVLATIGGYKRMRSWSEEDGARIYLNFDWGIDANVKALEVKEKLDGIRHLFPADLERFYIRKWSTSDMEILALRISSNRDLSGAYDMLNRNVKRRLERIEGVSRVDLYGIEKPEIRIQIDADKLISHRIDISRLIETLRRSNYIITAGKITDANRRFVVRPLSEFQTVEDIRQLIVSGTNIRLKDVAEVTHEMPVLNYGRHLDRQYAIGVDVYKEAGANTVEVTDQVMDEVDVISEIPDMEGITIYTMNNLGDGIVSSINELLKSGVLGGFLAIFVLYFFLRRLVTTLIVSISVPFSILITMACMYFMGISLNILSMMGLMLAVGMLVDNAVVVTESIHRHQMQDKMTDQPIRKGVKEVALAITAGTMTTVIVFLPTIVSQKDDMSVYIKHVSVALCIALGASLLMAQTIVPLLAKRVKAPREIKKNKIVDRLIDRYEKILKWMLTHRWAAVGIILLVLFSVAAPMQMVKTDMFDEPEDRVIRLRYHINGSYTLEKVEEAVNIYEEYLFSHQEEFDIESIYTYYQNDYAMSTIILNKGKKATKGMDEVKDAIRANLPRLPITDPSFDWRSHGDRGASVQVQLIGKSSEQLVEISKDIEWILSQVSGLEDVKTDAETGKEEVHVVVDRKRAVQYGFTPGEVANVVAAAMRGINLRRFRDEEGEILMRLEFQDEDRQTLDQLMNVPLFSGGEGQPLKLAALADFHVRRGPRSIHRENRTTSLNVMATIDDITMGVAREKIGKVLANYHFPPGYTWNYGERFDYEQEAMNTMLFNLLMALILIYFLMASLFESLLFPSAIWTQILFSIVGVYWFFLITGTTMSIMAMIGILILIGVVVNNGIVLIDYVNQLRERGMPRQQALLQAGRDRLRPILMTAGTTVLSLVPLCIVTTQIGGDGPPYFPMARAMVGGLTFSTAITLLVLPTIYELLDDLRNWSRGVVKRART